MFGTTILLGDHYDYHTEKFQLAYEFLRRPDLAVLPEGAVQLGQGVVAHIQHYNTSSPQTLKFETHKKFFDVQYMVSGVEMFGLVNSAYLEPDSEYHLGNDITFYKEPSYSGSLLMNEGDFIIVGPEEAHKPRCLAGSSQAVIKVVVKVPV